MATLLVTLAFTVVQAQIVPAPVSDPMLAAWIADLSSKDQKVQLAARDALVKMGPKAKAYAPKLEASLGDKLDMNKWETYYVIDVLGSMGPDAKVAEAKLKSYLDPMKLNAYAMERLVIALGNISGPTQEMTKYLLHAFTKGRGIVLSDSEYLTSHKKEVATHLIALIDDKEPGTRGNAIRVLTGTDSGFQYRERIVLAKVVEGISKDVSTVLEKRLKDEVAYIRIAAALGYSKTFPENAIKVLPVVVETMTDEKFPLAYNQCELILAPIPNETAKALIPLLDGPDHGRAWAIDTLAKMNLHAPLETALKSGKTARSRSAAATAMGHRWYKATAAVPPLQLALADTDLTVRLAAAEGILNKAERDNDAIGLTVPILQEGLKSESAEVRLNAIVNLRRVGNRAIPAVPVLKTLLTDKDAKVALEATFATVELAPKEAEAGIPALIDAINNSKDLGKIPAAAKALAEFGPKAKAALPALAKQLKDDAYPSLNVPVAEAIARIDPEQTEKMVTTLVAVYKKYTSGIGIEAVNSLARIGPSAKTAVPVLMEAIRKTQMRNSFRTELVIALMAIDPEAAKPYVEWLRKNMADVNSEFQWPIVRDLSHHGSAAKPFIPELIIMLDSKDQSVQGSAARTLSNLGKDASAALPKLKEVAEKKATRPAVRKEAAAAVKYIEQGIVVKSDPNDD